MRPILMVMPVLVIALSSALSAKKPPEPTLPTPPTISATPLAVMISGFDQDSDAHITRSEFDAGVARSFNQGDTNGDGRITLLELSNWAQHWLGNPGALPGQYDFDRDGDDAISRDEYTTEFAKRFAGFDTDKNNILVHSELISLTPGRPQNGPRHGPPVTPPKK